MDEYVLRVPSPPKEREREAGNWVLDQLERVRQEYVHQFGGEVFKVVNSTVARQPANRRRRGVTRTPIEEIEAQTKTRRGAKP